MEYRPIEVKLICAKDLKDVNVFSKMDVYVVGSVSGDPRSMQQTAADKDGGINPTWNHIMRFNVDESAARLNRLGLVFQIMSNRTLGDKEVGRVYVPLKELFDSIGEILIEEKNVVYQVQTSTGRFKGQLKFSYKFGEKFTYTFDQKLDHPNGMPLDFIASEPVFESDRKINESFSMYSEKIHDEPVMAYPARPIPMSGPCPGSMTGYEYGHGHGYSLQQPLPNPPSAYMGYGYGYPGECGYRGQSSSRFVQQPVKVKQPEKKGIKFGVGAAAAGAGVGVGLVGGLLVGEMVEDVGETTIFEDFYYC
ncbi:hypothetical protein RND81_04G206400 [Saponaria officinalis]|uniref:C2 domain-containing protein n=1 Tax=Saponaria officinalis TaxID=3572 RepID=A0AAW1LR27_SAPOF